NRNVKVDILVPPVWCRASERPWPDGRISSWSCCTGTTAGWLLRRPIGESAVSAADESGCEGLSRKARRDKQKRKVWIDGGIHAREWISPATVLYMADVYLILAQKRAKRTVATRLKAGLCRGVDLNRNYGYKINYRAPGHSLPWSRPAVKEIRRAGELRQEDLAVPVLPFIRPVRLMPFGFQEGRLPAACAQRWQDAAWAFFGSREMFSTNHRFYIHGTSADVLYEASGGSDDWAHGSLEVPYSLTVELPDDGAYGFPAAACLHSPTLAASGAGPAGDVRTIHDLETNTNFYRTRRGLCMKLDRISNRQREYDGGILLGRDRIESLQVSAACSANGDSLRTSAASFRAREAFCSPSAAITCGVAA
uniref:Peptidase_M14 domain-containing protein n=1 Tax=Macrostomum lignano TaxID=282301 RepID=A0A1I8FMS3_9PLAT